MYFLYVKGAENAEILKQNGFNFLKSDGDTYVFLNNLDFDFSQVDFKINCTLSDTLIF